MVLRLLLFGYIFYLFSKFVGFILKLAIKKPKDPAVKGEAENAPLDFKEQDVQDVDFEDIQE